MLRSKNTKTSAVLIVVIFAILMTLGPATSNFQNAFAHYRVDIDQCKDGKDYYEDNEDDCDKNLRAHYDEDYDGDFGSKNIDDEEDKDDDKNTVNSASQGSGQSQSSAQNSQVVSDDDTEGSGNNLSFQNQEHSGNNAVAQG